MFVEKLTLARKRSFKAINSFNNRKNINDMNFLSKAMKQ